MNKLHLARAALQGILPFGSQLRRVKRRLRPYQDDPRNSDYCISQGLDMIAALDGAGVKIRGAEVLEFGCGWLPLIPMLFHLAGARRLILTDVERLMDPHTIERARTLVAGRLDDVAGVLDRSVDDLRRGIAGPFAPDYLVPWDAATHPASSVDIVISRATFEHVPQAQLTVFLAQFHRILRPGGVMCHVIDNSDHWQHKDRRLSRIEFLRYRDSEWIWRLAQLNTQSYQNRLRHSDYARLFRGAGFAILRSDGSADHTCLADLRDLPLAEPFKSMDMRDLAILTSLFVLRKEG